MSVVRDTEKGEIETTLGSQVILYKIAAVAISRTDRGTGKYGCGAMVATKYGSSYHQSKPAHGHVVDWSARLHTEHCDRRLAASYLGSVWSVLERHEGR